MKKLMFLFSLFMELATYSSCQTITVLEKDGVFTASESDMVVMDKYTFGKYHYTAAKYDTLKQNILELDSVLQEREVTHSLIVSEYRRSLENKDTEIDKITEAYFGTKRQLESSIDKNNQLVVEYRNLQARRNKMKRWRNVFMGTTALTTGILILIITL